MLHRYVLTGVVGLLVVPALAWSDEAEGAKVLDRFVGVWQNDITRKGPESPETRKLTSNEVIAKELVGRYIIGREMNPKSDVKVMWFMTYDPPTKNYALTYFNTQGLLGTEWKGTWSQATSTLTSKSNDAPPTWTSESVYRFVGEDKVEAQAWMKNDTGKLIFETSFTKVRQPAEAGDKILAAWREPANPNAELSPELKVLDRLAGSWEVTALYKKAAWTPEEKTLKSKVSRKWILNRMFLQDISSGEDGSSSIALSTYDAKQKAYRGWWFSSEGYTTKSRGQWDAATNTLTFDAKLPEGQNAHSSVHFIDNNHHEWKVLIHDADGKVYFDTTWTCGRAK